MSVEAWSFVLEVSGPVAVGMVAGLGWSLLILNVIWRGRIEALEDEIDGVRRVLRAPNEALDQALARSEADATDRLLDRYFGE